MEEFLKSKTEREVNEEEYLGLLGAYDAKLKEIKKKEKRFQIGGADEESRRLVKFLDKERNEIHQKLKSVGEKIGKSELDILTDIIRQNKNLEQYGLPEFFLLDSNDIESYEFNLDNNFEPKNIKLERDSTLRRIMDQSSVVIPYAIGYKSYDGYDPDDTDDEGQFVYPKDISVRTRRAYKLALEAGFLEVMDDMMDGPSFHESSAMIVGVVVPKTRLEEVLGIIRNNPEKFRIGEKFYSKEEKKEIKEDE